MSETPTATRTRTTFRLEYAVSVRIDARPSRIWSLLTNAGDFPRWNSTVKTIEGSIAEGETIRLVATIAPKRTFKLRVAELERDKRMVWRDGLFPMFQGVRTFTLTPVDDGSTEFAMKEVFRGLMLPMIAGSLPDFGPVFEQYATDLKTEVEKGKMPVGPSPVS
jgi:hypothetical protein